MNYKKKINLTDILLFSVSEILDFFQDIKDPGGLISNYYQNYYGFVPPRWKKNNLHCLIKTNIKNQRLRKNKKSKSYHLTNIGKQYLYHKYPTIIKRKTKWNKKWNILIFDIYEDRKYFRDILRERILKFGFGQLQKSVWINPYDFSEEINKIAKTYYIRNQIYSFTISKINELSNKQIVERCWPLNNINDIYSQLYTRLIKSLKQYNNLNDINKLQTEFLLIQEKFIDTFKTDPFLPKELLPKKWNYPKLAKLINKIRRFVIKKK